MHHPVVGEGNGSGIDADAVEQCARHATAALVRILDGDLVARTAVAEGEREAAPRRRDAGVESERLSCEAQSENAFQPGAIEPACRAGVPAPAAPPGMLGMGVDVAREHIGLGLVALDVGAAAAVVDRIEHVKELDRLVAAAQRRDGHQDPDGGMGVLPAVLAHSGRIAADVAGVLARQVERRL